MRISLWESGIACLLLFAAPHYAARGQTLFIRVNQLGFRPGDHKEATILARRNLSGAPFTLRSGVTSVYTGRIGESRGRYGQFPLTYAIDFTRLRTPGRYTIQIQDQESVSFAIGDALYDGLADSLLLFFRVQRCGDHSPLLHEPCHLHDATGIVDARGTIRKNLDAEGGWHDAGDYVKFLNTTAFATYTMLFAYEFDPQAFDVDRDTNGTPAILREARVGLDWILKACLQDGKLITQVQDLRDHDQGWRLPEDDGLVLDRPAFLGIGKNLIGIVSATLATASAIWRPHDPRFADKCLTKAEDLYSRRSDVPDIDVSGTGMYRDNHFLGKLALGAIELYRATGNPRYLPQAKAYASSAGADFWWSWGDVNAYADYRLASIDRRFAQFLRQNLLSARSVSNRNVFGEAVPGNWGSTHAMLGMALQAILWKQLFGGETFDTLAQRQCDYILGRNPWGVCFMANTGANPARHFHSQVAYFRNGYLPGGLAGGPVTAATMRQYSIPLEHEDRYAEFQSDVAVYHDDRMDYVTNEPTIAAAATAIVVLGSHDRQSSH